MIHLMTTMTMRVFVVALRTNGNKLEANVASVVMDGLIVLESMKHQAEGLPLELLLDHTQLAKQSKLKYK